MTTLAPAVSRFAPALLRLPADHCTRQGVTLRPGLPVRARHGSPVHKACVPFARISMII